MTDTIQFDDGAAYERYMGRWSQLAGDAFLEWLAPARGLQWLDVGCGNGAFTEMIAERLSPASVHGIDPSEEQLAYARVRPSLRHATLEKGDAMALPFANDSFDAAVMPLVIFFVPEPAVGVAEMARVVRAGGLVAAYAWDMLGGFPYALLQDEMRAVGAPIPVPPSSDASRLDAMRELWIGAGMHDVETCQIEVERVFANFGEYWDTIHGGPSVRRQLAAMDTGKLALLEARLRERLQPDAQGRITCSARTNAVKARVRSGAAVLASPHSSAVS